MSKQTVYGTMTATVGFNNRPVSFYVPAGEVESDDGIIYNTATSISDHYYSKPLKVERSHSDHKLPRRIKNKPRRKLERQNRLKGRR